MIPIWSMAPTLCPPFVTRMLIRINCFAFFVEIRRTPAELEEFLLRVALIPARNLDSAGPRGSDGVEG